MKHKICTKCKVNKPVSDYYLLTSGQLFSECKDCMKQRVAAYKKKHHTKINKDVKKYKKSRECFFVTYRNLYWKEYFKLNKRAQQLKALIHHHKNRDNEERVKELSEALGKIKIKKLSKDTLNKIRNKAKANESVKSENKCILFKCSACGMCRCTVKLFELTNPEYPKDCPWGTNYPCNWRRSSK